VTDATLYSLFSAFPIVFEQGRGWNAGVGGLAFLGSKSNPYAFSHKGPLDEDHESSSIQIKSQVNVHLTQPSFPPF